MMYAVQSSRDIDGVAGTLRPLCVDEVHTAAQFFTANIDTGYISHGELLSGRATAAETWSNDLNHVMEQELRGATENQKMNSSFVFEHRGEITGLVIWSRPLDSPQIVILDDLVIHPDYRRYGLGAWILNELETWWKAQDGITHILLESGVHNHRAHTFFEREGFAVMSHTFVKQIREK